MTRPSPTAVLEATIRLIGQGGIDSVRYRDVSKASGVALGTISYRYPTREALIRSAFKHFLSMNETALRIAVEAARIRGPRDVATLIASILEQETKGPERNNLAEYEFVVYAGRDKEMAEALAMWDRRVTSELAVILERIGVQSPFAIAATLLELARGFQVVRLSQRHPDFDDLRARIERVLIALTSAPPLAGMEPQVGKNIEKGTNKRSKK